MMPYHADRFSGQASNRVIRTQIRADSELLATFAVPLSRRPVTRFDTRVNGMI